MKLNAEQELVVTTCDKSQLVMAPAGTGKTMVIGQHIDLLCSKYGVLASDIMCLTFTARACREMKSRITNKGVDIRTINSLYNRFITLNYKLLGFPKPEITIIDKAEMQDVLFHVCQEMHGPAIPPFVLLRYFEFLCRESPYYANWISTNLAVLDNKYCAQRLSTENRVWDQWYRQAGALWIKSVLEYCIQQGIMDFGLSEVFCDILSQHEHAIKVFANYKHIMIDEIQDTSRTQYNILYRLFAGRLLCLFGDFNQTIYRWRGSDPDYLRDQFISQFKPVETYFLENYRSTPMLTYYSHAFLDPLNNTNLCSYIPTPEGKIPVFLSGPSYLMRTYQMLCRLKEHFPESSIAVLSRTHATLDRLNKYVQGQEGNIRLGTVQEYAFSDTETFKLFCQLLEVTTQPTSEYPAARLMGRFNNKLRDSRVMFSDLLDVSWDPASGRSYYADLFQAIEDKTLMIFDLETTSTVAYEARMVQAFVTNAVTAEDYQGIVKLNGLVGDSVDVHGFTDEFLQTNGRGLREVLIELKTLLDNKVLAGHNVYYDLQVLNEELAREELPPIRPLRVYDTLKEAQRFIRDVANYKLDTLREYFQGNVKASHNARDDVYATKFVFAKLIAKFIKPNLQIVDKQTAMVYRDSQSVFDVLRKHIAALLLGDSREVLCWCSHIAKSEAFDKEVAYMEDFLLTAKSLTGRYQELASLIRTSRSELDILLFKQSRIPAITIHQAKGCEFDFVIIIENCDNSRSEDLDMEEARLFYVALTRAKQNMILITSANSLETLSAEFRALPTELTDFRTENK